MRYLIFDFETNGIDKDNDNQYRPYPDEKKPLPRENYPVELGACLIEKDGTIVNTQKMIIRGAQRLSPWVEQNCSISLKTCERDGVSFSEVLQQIATMIGDEPCTLVAHNIQYDWDDVLETTAKDMNLTDTPAFLKLKQCPRYCTCVNKQTMANKSAYYHRKLKRWLGPKLEALARSYGVEYSARAAHEALYDVEVTRQCFVKSRIVISNRGGTLKSPESST